ncbi:phage tail assembly chaperone [Pseudomonas protegens]|uniref:phage tail assembly chaperone n=1 Tax=Pseudomonas protegens TaxID=380021 RepID=UPI000F49034C|nr:phage tail assembly chaperone [Pseudomonas protegens]ROL86569.1 phage tail protein [Pseudomonas protegens]ROL95095.1 phage tail protein [Pseudomonas protegens]ROL97918.1 phage tail protein [Pseudomonas protegens]ROM07704.1 phage tail protein [Pseudomonas protegens]
MQRFYSQSTKTTYLKGLHDSIPSDAVEISNERYLSVIGNPGPGKIRAHDELGLPYLIDAPKVVPDLAAEERQWRDAELTSVMWLRERHRDQLEVEAPATLTVEQFKELLVYMQALRDWPQSPDFPQIEHRPVLPPWIAEQTE